MNDIVRKAKQVKSDIDLINWHLTIIDQPDARVSVVNETPVTKIYSIKFKSCGAECQKSVEFNGSIAKFFQSVDIRNYGLRSIESSGYLGWKLGVLRRDLDKKIKQQENAKKCADKKRVRAEKIAKKMQEMRNALSDLVFGHDKTL